MKKIDSVYISPYTYDVRYDDRLSVNAGALGATATDETYIVLDSGSPRQVLAETLLHECLHAVWSQTALLKNYTNDQQEEIIYSLTPRLVALMKDNGQLVEEIVRER